MAQIHSLIATNSKVQLWNILREEAQGNIGLFRYRVRIRRWDNAAHHPEVRTYSFHLHDGDENNVLPSPPMNVTDILVMLEALI